MDRVSIRDVLAASYDLVEAPVPMSRSNTALLLVDVQELATPEHLIKRAVRSGMDAAAAENAVADYAERFYAAVANCAQLLQASREAEIARIHVRIEALSGNARDTGPSHRRLGWCYPPGSPETRFLEPVAPAEGEIVISKTVSGAFTATNLDTVLRHMGIQWLVVAGFASDECIEATGRAALDLGYLALLAEDACAAYEADSHDAFMGKYASWGLARSTDSLLKKLAKL